MKVVDEVPRAVLTGSSSQVWQENRLAWKTSSRWCDSDSLNSRSQMLCARSFMHLTTPVMDGLGVVLRGEGYVPLCLGGFAID